MVEGIEGNSSISSSFGANEEVEERQEVAVECVNDFIGKLMLGTYYVPRCYDPTGRVTGLELVERESIKQCDVGRYNDSEWSSTFQ